MRRPRSTTDRPSALALGCIIRTAEAGEAISARGDLEEEYARRSREDGPARARRWLWGQALRSLPSLIVGHALWSLQMLKNHLTLSLRNIRLHKGHALINLFGFAIGLTCCILIYLWTADAKSYNSFHRDAGRIYRINYETVIGGSRAIQSGSFAPLARLAKASCPQVLEAGRIASDRGLLLKSGENTFPGLRVLYVDPSFLQIFTFSFVRGDARTALSDTASCVLTEETAARIFGRRDPVGMTLGRKDGTDIRVMGVVRSFPRQSDYQADVLLPFRAWQDPGWADSDDSWGGNPLETYVRIRPGTRPADAAATLTAALERKSIYQGMKVVFRLQPLSRVHIENAEGIGMIQYVPVFSLIAGLVLLIACFNFLNLSTAQAARRAREVGLRKVVGARRSDLVRQFFAESLLMAGLALALALGLTALCLPAFSKLVGTPVGWAIALNGAAAWKLAAIVALVALVAGGYPALVLSAFRPVRILKGDLAPGSRGASIRKILVVVQFAASIFLIVATLGINRQIRFMREKGLGFDQSNILSMNMAGPLAPGYETFKTELLRFPDILGVTRSLEHPANVYSSVWNADWEGREPQARVSLGFMYVDFDFFKTFGMTMASGRPFSRVIGSDINEGYILNDAAVRTMGIRDPVGKRLSIFNKPGTIIGVVRDFHFQPMNEAIHPLVLGMGPGVEKGNVFVKVAPDGMTRTLGQIEGVWSKLFPGRPFSPGFFSDRLRFFYQPEKQIVKLIGLFTLLAVFVSCLGLFGLASFMAEQKTKEIGIRRVLGAPISWIARRLTTEFARYVVLANLVSWPLAYWAVTRWLQEYAYRIRPDWSMFVLAGAAALFVAVLTVSGQAYRAARRNPVDSIRYQ